jgi:rod shape-determining protein MreD
VTTLIPLIILISAALLQTSLSPYIKISGVHPDLVFVLVIGWVTLRGLEEGHRWALLGGLSLDLLSGAPFGVFTVSLLLVALIANLFHGRTLVSSVVLPLSLTFPLSLLFDGLALLFLAFLGWHIVWIDAFFSKLLPVAIFNTMTMMLVFPLLYLLNRFLSPRRLSF